MFSARTRFKPAWLITATPVLAGQYVLEKGIGKDKQTILISGPRNKEIVMWVKQYKNLIEACSTVVSGAGMTIGHGWMKRGRMPVRTSKILHIRENCFLTPILRFVYSDLRKNFSLTLISPISFQLGKTARFSLPGVFRLTSLIALGVFVASIEFAHARDFRLIKGEQEKVCQNVLQRINAAEANKEELLFYLPKLFPKPELREGYYYFKNEKGKAKRPVGFVEFDIDNDGSDEMLVFESSSYKMYDDDILLVFKKGEVDFSVREPEFTYEQYINLKGVRSSLAHPYAKESLFGIKIGFLRYEKINHLVIWDVRFTEPEMARALIVAKYINSPLQKRNKNDWTTDKLGVVCKIL